MQDRGEVKSGGVKENIDAPLCRVDIVFPIEAF